MTSIKHLGTADNSAKAMFEDYSETYTISTDHLIEVSLHVQ